MTDAKSPHHVESLREQVIDTRKRAQMVYFSERTLELLIPKVTYYLYIQLLPCRSSVKWDFQL